MSYLATLISSPWALRRELMPLASRVLSRLARGEPMSEADRAAVADGQLAAAAQSTRYADYAGTGGDVAVVPILGVLTQRGDFTDMSEPTTSMSRLATTIARLAAAPSVAAIVLDVDSPGGSVLGVSELADAIYAARAAKPVAAVANSCAASAAYWLASQAGEFYAAPGAETGSIGCYAMHTNVTGALQQDGVEVTLVSAGKYKTELSSFGPLSDDARAHLQGTVDQYFNAFVAAVARGRRTSIKAVREDMGQGRMLLPDAAKAARMIDGTATLDQVIAKMQARTQRGGSSAAGLSARAAAAARQREIDILALS
jgi:signal peptide peptidase SppA